MMTRGVDEGIDVSFDFDAATGTLALLWEVRRHACELMSATNMETGIELGEPALESLCHSDSSAAPSVQCLFGNVAVGRLRFHRLLAGVLPTDRGYALELNFQMSSVPQEQWSVATRELFRFASSSASRFGARDYRAGSENPLSDRELLFHGRNLCGAWIDSRGLRFEPPPWWYRLAARLTW